MSRENREVLIVLEEGEIGHAIDLDEDILSFSKGGGCAAQ